MKVLAYLVKDILFGCCIVLSRLRQRLKNLEFDHLLAYHISKMLCPAIKLHGSWMVRMKKERVSDFIHCDAVTLPNSGLFTIAAIAEIKSAIAFPAQQKNCVWAANLL